MGDLKTTLVSSILSVSRRYPSPTVRILFSVLVVFLLALWLNACGADEPGDGEPAPVDVATIAAVEATEPSDPAPPTPTPASPESETLLVGQASPTADPEERVLTLRPRGQDIVWWTSGELRGHVGDSFLYAGQSESEIFLTAFRFDLSSVPRGAPIRSATLRLTGERVDRLNGEAGGTWRVQFLAPGAVETQLPRATFQEVYNAPAAISLLPELNASDLGQGVVNSWTLDPSSRLQLTLQLAADKTSEAIVRITGPSGGADNLFAWDSGVGATSGGNGPVLELVLGTPPSTPLASQPTPTPVVIAATPTPRNLETRVAEAVTATAMAVTIGTYTPTPPNLATATPIAPNLEALETMVAINRWPPVVVHTPVPANEATAAAAAWEATAIAVTTGTFTPVPTNAVTPVIIIPTPMPENVMTAVYQRDALAIDDNLPFNAVLATLTPTPIVVTSTPTPENEATAALIAQLATAVAVTTGTFTPTPDYMFTATPLPTPTPTATLLPFDWLDTLTATPTPLTPTPLPEGMPADLVGKVLFFSDREGGNGLYAVDPADGRLARVNYPWLYDLAKTSEQRASDGQRRVLVQDDIRRVPQVYIHDSRYDATNQLTTLTGSSYDPVWSPVDDRIAFVSTEPGNDEIYVINADGSNLQRLTTNEWEWDKHPSWSPDGSQIVFWSNREGGRAQLWVMNSDGSNQRRLLDSPFNDTYPIWVK